MTAANRAGEALALALKITIAKLKKQRFGSSSQKIEREIEQLELALESLETARAAADATPEADAPENEAPETNGNTVVETAKLFGLDTQAYLANFFGRMRQHDPKRLDGLLPWTWKECRDAKQKAA